MSDLVKIGYPNNPVSLMKHAFGWINKKTGKFEVEYGAGCSVNPDTIDDYVSANYLPIFHGGVDLFIDQVAPGGTVETPHGQDRHEITKEKLPKIKAEVDMLKDKGVNVMGHFTFMLDKNREAFDELKTGIDYEQFLEDPELQRKVFEKHPEFKLLSLYFDFEWDIIPNAFKPITIPMTGQTIDARIIPPGYVMQQIDVFAAAGIQKVTRHFSKPGVILTPEELDIVERRLNNMIQRYIERNNYDTTLCMEFGGIVPEELFKRARKNGWKVNCDVSHLRLEMDYLPVPDNIARLSPREQHKWKDKRLVQLIRENLDLIANWHINQADRGVDSHKKVFDKEGYITCNDQVLKLLQELHEQGKQVDAMFECLPDLKNTIYLNDVITGRKEKIKPRYFNIFCGLPASGKSATADMVIATRDKLDMGTLIRSDREKKNLEKELAKHAHEVIDIGLLRDDELFPREFRDFCYRHYVDKINYALRRGESSTLDATLNTRDYWELIYGVLDAHPDLEGVYIVITSADDKDVMERLAKREQEKVLNGNGTQTSFVLSKYDIYKQMKKEQSRYLAVDVLRKRKDNDKIHIIMYDTSKQEMKFFNKDSRLEEFAISIKQYVKTNYGKDVKFEE